MTYSLNARAGRVLPPPLSECVTAVLGMSRTMLSSVTVDTELGAGVTSLYN